MKLVLVILIFSSFSCDHHPNEDQINDLVDRHKLTLKIEKSSNGDQFLVCRDQRCVPAFFDTEGHSYRFNSQAIDQNEFEKRAKSHGRMKFLMTLIPVTSAMGLGSRHVLKRYLGLSHGRALSLSLVPVLGFGLIVSSTIGVWGQQEQNLGKSLRYIFSHNLRRVHSVKAFLPILATYLADDIEINQGINDL